MEEIQFTCTGEFELEKPYYYRVQGKPFLIKFDSPQTKANLIHSLRRHFAGDLIMEHNQNSDHH